MRSGPPFAAAVTSCTFSNSASPGRRSLNTQNSIQKSSQTVLTGEWWLIRQARIPLTDQRIDQNRREWSRNRGRRSKIAAQTSIAMSELTEKAAKLCFRINALNLLRNNHASGRISDAQTNPGLIQDHYNRFDFPTNREWSLRLNLQLDRWTPDLLYKLAAIRGVGFPSPSVLDWGGCVTWLMIHQAEVPGGTMPLDLLLYAACGVSIMSLEPQGQGKDTRFVRRPISHHEDQYTEWQQLSIQLLEDYLRRPSTMISTADRAALKLMLFREQVELFQRAAECSDRVCKSLQRFGVRGD